MSRDKLIDTHLHLWVMSEREYSWIAPECGPLYDDFKPERLEPGIADSGVTSSILVQAADTYEDTFYMLDIAAHSSFVVGVVGWVPFNRPSEALAAIEVLKKSPYIKGFRNLTHDYSNSVYESDPAWILRAEALQTISTIAEAGLTLDYVAVNADHIKNIPILAKRFPDLKIVIDHFAKPDIANKVMEPWASLMAECASYPNVYAKLSGLNTASSPEWSFSDWHPYVDHIIEVYGADRTMMGGDWPVCILAGDYVRVWKAQLDVISKYSETDQEWLCYKTAEKFYNLY